MPTKFTESLAKESLGNAASKLAEAGRVVFPVTADKRPRRKFGGLAPGPHHVLQVRSWWRRWPESNIALRTGDGLAVIDVDPRHGGLVDPAWPATLMAHTPRGGFHLYYRTDKPVRNSVGEVAPGVDVRGERGFVVVPPSPGYVWAGDASLTDEAMAELPELGSATRPRELRGDWRPFDLPDTVPLGQRHNFRVRYAGWLWSQGYDEDEIVEALQDYSDADGHAPKPGEIEQVAAWVAGKEGAPSESGGGYVEIATAATTRRGVGPYRQPATRTKRQTLAPPVARRSRP